MANVTTSRGGTLETPPLLHKLFNDTRAGWLWLPLRLWLGYQWIEAASHKITNPAWMQTGVALKGFWASAVSVPEQGRPPITYDWYRAFIQMLLDAQAYTWFAKLVAVGELMIGVGLVLGAFTAVAAFFGAFMNWNFIMAGTASTNPMLLVAAIALLVAWKVSGYIGADYFILRRVGTLWQRRLVATTPAPAVGQPAPANSR